MSSEHAHPTPKTYAKIAAILCLVTAIEVWVFYLDALQPMLVPLLTVFSVIKFCLVVMFYMHLKFDHSIFTRVMLSGLLLKQRSCCASVRIFPRFVTSPRVAPRRQ